LRSASFEIDLEKQKIKNKFFFFAKLVEKQNHARQFCMKPHTHTHTHKIDGGWWKIYFDVSCTLVHSPFNVGPLTSYIKPK
jgi:hypothetical protein